MEKNCHTPSTRALKNAIALIGSYFVKLLFILMLNLSLSRKVKNEKNCHTP
jgi:hypothetical protein